MSEHPITEQMLAAKNATGHSIFGPSSAHRWFRCPRSLVEAFLAGDRPTKFSAEGSVAHWLADDWLKNGNPYRHLDTVVIHDGFEIEITEEMISYVEEYVAWVSTAGGRHYTETRVNLSAYTPVPSFGTTDHCHASWNKLVVTDLKYGKVWVSAEENEQGLCYALGMFDELDWMYDFQEITFRICQPRRNNFDEWTFSRKRMLDFREELREAAHKAWDPLAPYNPDPVACEYCPASTTCPAFVSAMESIAQQTFDDFDDEGGVAVSQEKAVAVIEGEIISDPTLPDYRKVPLAQLARVYRWRPMFESWFKDLYGYLFEQLEAGEDVPGFKLGNGRAGNRKWEDEDAARRFLMRNGISTLDLYSHKFLSPNQATELLKVVRGGTLKENEAEINRFAIRPPGKRTMIPSDDVRLALPSAASAFDDVD